MHDSWKHRGVRHVQSFVDVSRAVFCSSTGGGVSESRGGSTAAEGLLRMKPSPAVALAAVI